MPMATLKITPTIAIDESELDERFVQSSGPGGQNVNKVATAVQLRFDVARSLALSEPVKQRLRALAGRRMTADGVLVIDARRFRTQERNRADARERLTQLIRQATLPTRKRIPTRPTLAAKRRRLDVKKSRSATKRTRSRPTIED
jgi:ribosome-associated protein